MCVAVFDMVETHNHMEELRTFVKNNQIQINENGKIITNAADELNRRTPIIAGLTKDLAVVNSKIDQIEEQVKALNTSRILAEERNTPKKQLQ